MESQIFLDGRLRLMNNNRTVVLTFCCNEIHQLCLRSKIYAITVVSKSVTEIRIKPARAPTRLFSDGWYGICLVMTKYLPKRIVTPKNRYRRVRVILDPSEFGLHREDLIEDNDGRILFNELKKFGFKLYPVRATCNNGMGDLLVLRGGKLYSFHITRYNPKVNNSDKRLRLRHYIIGKIAFQCFKAKQKLNAICKAITHSNLYFQRVLTPDVENFFRLIGIYIILSDFKQGWQRRISDKVLKLTDTVRSSTEVWRAHEWCRSP